FDDGAVPIVTAIAFVVAHTDCKRGEPSTHPKRQTAPGERCSLPRCYPCLVHTGFPGVSEITAFRPPRCPMTAAIGGGRQIFPKILQMCANLLIPPRVWCRREWIAERPFSL